MAVGLTLVAGCFQQYSNGALSRIHRRQITGRTAGAWFPHPKFLHRLWHYSLQIFHYSFSRRSSQASLLPTMGKAASHYWVYGSFCWCSLLNRFGALVSFQNPEIPPTAEELEKMKQHKGSLFDPVIEIISAIRTCQNTLANRAGIPFQWYAMFCYWQFISHSIAKSSLSIPAWKILYEAVGWTGLVNGFIMLACLCMDWPGPQIRGEIRACHACSRQFR